MRPRYLEIEGLQSFKELQRVDFDKLSETGLFGIFGPTGSGKSTVLDAITLALYGEVHRAVRGTQGIINTASHSVKVSFSFDLLKGNIRKTYRVDRTYVRKKGSENSCEARLARLVEITENGEVALADKPGEVSSRVEELIGLKPGDFTRAVVLPQNKFQEFLFLEKAKKREMLERIFYLEEYGRLLTDKVSKKLSEVRLKLSSIQGAISALGDASRDALDEAENRFREAEARRRSVDREFKLIEEAFNEAKEIWQLQEELREYEMKENQHCSRAEKINRDKYRYERAMKAESFREAMHKYVELVKKLEATADELSRIENCCHDTEQRLAEAKKNYEDAVMKWKEERTLLIEKKARLEGALGTLDEIEAIEQKLKKLREEYVRLKESILAKEKEIALYKEQAEDADKKAQEYKRQMENIEVDLDYREKVRLVARLEAELKYIAENRDNCRSKFDKAALEVESVKIKLDRILKEREELQRKLQLIAEEKISHELKKPCDRNAVMKQINDLNSVRSLYERLRSKKVDLDSALSRKETLKKNVEQLKINYDDALRTRTEISGKLNEIKIKMDECTRLYEKNLAYILSRDLEDGCPCPVCGSTYHPAPAAMQDGEKIKELEARLEQLKELYEDTDRSFRDAENICIKIGEQLKGFQEQYMQAEDDARERTDEFSAIISMLPAHMQNMELEEIGRFLDDEEKDINDSLRLYETWEIKLDDLKNQFDVVNGQVSNKISEEKACQAELEVYRQNLLQAEAALRESEACFNEKEQSVRQFNEKLGIANAEEELKRLEDNERKLRSIQVQVEKLQGIASDSRKAAEKLIEERQKLYSRFDEVRVEGDGLKNEKMKLETRIKEIAGDGDIKIIIEETTNRLNDIVLEEKKLSYYVKELEDDFNSLRIRRSALDNEYRIYSQNVEDENKRLQNSLKEKGFESLQEVEQALIAPEEMKQLLDEITMYEKEEQNIKAQKAMLVAKLKGRHINEDEWNEINDRYQSMLNMKEESIALYENAKNIYNNIKENHRKWIVLNEEQKEYTNKADMLEQIQKLLKGNSFVEFIAEERLRYIAREASETLGMLTKYRYSIEIDIENGFVIRDNANGGVCRLVSSLSGGEIFLTSLSLALALSKQVQLKGQSPLEFFFLDEGFGSLDSNLLDTVVDSLERLSSKDRIIGLISHVPELRNRISRRLIIEPPTADGKGTRVRIEKA